VAVPEGRLIRTGGTDASNTRWSHTMPSEVRLAEIKRLLGRHGWQLKRVSGSHHIFDRVGGPQISIPVHNGRVKHVYVRKIEKIIRGERH
jgi:predicted RNA binding protein YcfA (HicA-like mRNA interferase family)